MVSATFRVEMEGRDVSALVRDRLISMSIKDCADSSSDAFNLTLDNRDDLISFPKIDGALRVWMGFGNDLTPMGTYFIDEVTEGLVSGDLEIQAKAVRMSSTIKAQQTKTWKGAYTLEKIAQEVASQNGLNCRVHPKCRGHAVGHINQRAESDIALLTRLARKAGAVMKVYEQTVVIVPKGAGEMASGEPIPTVLINDYTLSDGRVTLQERGSYSYVQAAYFDESRQAQVNIKVGDGKGPTLVLKGREKTAEAAYAAADAKLRELQRGEATMSLTRPLTPTIVAPGKVDVRGHRKSANGVWFVESVTHTIGGGGHSSSAMSLTTKGYEAKEKKQ